MLGHARRRLTQFAAPRDAAGEATTAPIPQLDPRAGRQFARRLAVAFSATLALLLAVLGIVVALALRWEGVYPGVRASGADLSGRDREAMAALVADAAGRWQAEPITLTGPTGSFSFTRQELGLHYDQEATIAAALALGHTGSWLDRLGAIADIAWGGHELAAAYWVDDGMLRARLGDLAGATDVQARDGALRIEVGRVVVTPAIEGRGLDIDGSVALLIGAVAPDGPTNLTLPVSEHIQPRLNAEVLEAARLRAEALLATPVELRGEDVDLRYDAATIGSWLIVRQNAAPELPPIAIGIDQARIRAAIAPLAPQVRRDTRNAAYEYDRVRRAFVVSESGWSGRQLDVDRTVAAVVAALDGPGERVVSPVADHWAPGLSDADIAAASRLATRSYLAGPLVFTWEGQRWMLTVPELAQWIKILPGQNPADGPRLTFDEAALADYIAGLRGRVDLPAVNATYTMDNGSDVYRLTGPSQVGRTLDADTLLKTARTALAGGGQNRVLALPVGTVRPEVTEADVAALVPERWIDVDLTTQRMYAVVGKKVVYTAVISSGKKGWETPTGTYHILYRVENETMTSESIGAEENYRLENVLYTQYFTYEGHALHYSWWKTPESFGTPTSHGCLSETLADAEYFWNFASVGTRVSIRGVSPT